MNTSRAAEFTAPGVLASAVGVAAGAFALSEGASPEWLDRMRSPRWQWLVSEPR